MRRALRAFAVGLLLASAPIGLLAQDAGRGEHRSERTAVLLSVGGVVLPGVWSLVSRNGAIIPGVLVGPSIGHLYAGNYGRAIGGTLGRVGVSALGLVTGFLICSFDSIFDECDQPAASNAVLGVTAAAVVVWAVLDIVKAPESARRFNERHETPRPSPSAALPQVPSRGVGTLRGCVTICR